MSDKEVNLHFTHDDKDYDVNIKKYVDTVWVHVGSDGNSTLINEHKVDIEWDRELIEVDDKVEAFIHNTINSFSQKANVKKRNTINIFR